MGSWPRTVVIGYSVFLPLRGAVESTLRQSPSPSSMQMMLLPGATFVTPTSWSLGFLDLEPAGSTGTSTRTAAASRTFLPELLELPRAGNDQRT